MFKSKKQQPKEEKPLEPKIPPGLMAKATVKTMGTGELDLSVDTLKFTLKKGILGKQKDVAIKIPVADIENARQEGNCLVVIWNGITDKFVLQKTEALKPFLEALTAKLSQRKQTQAPAEDQTPDQKAKHEAEQQMRIQVPLLLNSAEEIVDPLFDLLRTLQGKTNWIRVEEHLKSAKQNAEAFIDLNSGEVNLSFSKLFGAVAAHVPIEAGVEVCSILKHLDAYFVGLASKSESLAQFHPNYKDAQNALRAYFTLNDVILGVEVGDEETAKESFEFSRMLDQLAQEIQITSDPGLLKETVGKLARGKVAENTVVECRALLRAHLCDLTKSASPPATSESDFLKEP